MSQELVEIGVSRGSIFLCQRSDFLYVRAEDCADAKAWKCLSSPDVSLSDISAADKSHMQHSVRTHYSPDADTQRPE